MTLHSISGMLGIASSNPAQLDFATDRLKEEHDQLRRRLKALENSAKEVSLLDDPAKGPGCCKT